ncbi:MAG: PhoH family protein [Deltaproteobacteria bacterium]|nr:PhoH family protein [Deltaproteobacteria bacterium]
MVRAFCFWLKLQNPLCCDKLFEVQTGRNTRQIHLSDNVLALTVFGGKGENLKRFEKKLGVSMDTRGSIVTISGDNDRVAIAERLVNGIYGLVEKGYQLSPQDLDYAIRILEGDAKITLPEVFLDIVYLSFKKKQIGPKGINQKRYIDAIRKHDIVFAIGPAGTGKTYLAMASAVAALAAREIDRIILTRPAVEAGERLGFLPGDLAAKIDPYLRPLYDALHDMMDMERAQKLLDRGTIEVAPLAFMRGRTLNDSFVILDEAQNTTVEQMKMFLTRLGFGSKAVVTGDITQIDLPHARTSGLVEAKDMLDGIEGIEFAYFTEVDVVRHPLVLEVIKAFDRVEKKRVALDSKEA